MSFKENNNLSQQQNNQLCCDNKSACACCEALWTSCLASDVLKARKKYLKSLTVDRMEGKEKSSRLFPMILQRLIEGENGGQGGGGV